jgi:hypothetical protein
VKVDDNLDMVMLSMIVLPHVGHMTWSACEVGGAEAEAPLLCVHVNILAGSRFGDRPSREIVIREGVRPMAVARCYGVYSSLGVRLTFMSSPLVAMGETVPLFVG